MKLGNGQLQQLGCSNIELPDFIHTINIDTDAPIEDLLAALIPEGVKSAQNNSMFEDRAILTPRNNDVDMLNRAFIDEFEEESIVYKSFDTLLDEKCHLYPTEFLHTLCPGGMSPHELILKENCPVMLIRNIEPSSGLCNGTRLRCKRFFANTILCEIATGNYKGLNTMIHRINLRPPSSSEYPFQFQRKQFPIKLSFVMTINKAQGQTLNEVGIYLRQPCFSHGQLYVALSRARKACKVRVITSIESPQDDICNPGTNQAELKIRNIISFDVLSRARLI